MKVEYESDMNIWIQMRIREFYEYINVEYQGLVFAHVQPIVVMWNRLILSFRPDWAGRICCWDPRAHAVAVATTKWGGRCRCEDSVQWWGGGCFISRWSCLLQADEGGIEIVVLAYQVLVRTSFHNLASLNHCDHISITDGGESVCNHNGGPADWGQVECFLDYSFRFSVQSTCSLIE